MATFNDRRGGGKTFEFHPEGWDKFDPRPNHPPAGTPVVMTSGGPGAPRNGTMGHSFVKHAVTGEFYGLVANTSLKRARKAR